MPSIRRLSCVFFALCSVTLDISYAAEETLQSLSDKVEALTELVLQQQKLLTKQCTELDDLRMTVGMQRNEIAEQAKKIQELDEWKQKPTHIARNVPHGRKGGIANKKPNAVADTVAFNHTRGQKRLVADVEGGVAFHAVILTGEVPHVGLHQHIIFDSVRLNLGGGYHVNHGLFIAPTAGIYIFSTSIVSYSKNNGDVFMAIMKNGNVVGSAYAQGTTAHPYDQGSVTVVVQLALADEVWVEDRYRSDRSIWGDSDTSFMGCLVVPM